MTTPDPQCASLARVAVALLAGAVAACAGGSGESAPGSPPSGLGYSVNPATYTAGLEITPNAPHSSGGPVAAYAVAPALPEGLSLDPDTGVLSGTPAGLARNETYAVTATNLAGSTTASLSVTVDRLNAIAVTPGDRTISLGLSHPFAATGAFELGGERDVTSLAAWESSDGRVATVDASGLARSAAEGTTTISASLCGARGTATLTVGPISLASLSIQNGAVLDIPADGRTLQLVSLAVYSDGSARDVTELATWSSAYGCVSVSDAAGTKGLVSTIELGPDEVKAAYLGLTALVSITVY